MPDISADVAALIQYLAPGFIVAWVYFGLTSHTKPSQFERVLQALIYTAIVRALVMIVEKASGIPGEISMRLPSNTDASLITSIVTAVSVGVLAAATTNHDLVYVVLRRLGLTTRTAHPCEWFGIFSTHAQFVTLHLDDGSRVGGWPQVWPADAKKGHFFITQAHRTIDGVYQELTHLEGVVINVERVIYVEVAAATMERDD